MDDRKQVLSRLDLFAGSSDRELSEISQIARWRKLHAEECLFRKGDDGAEVYVIVSGKLKAFATSADGTDRVFRYMGAGDVIGELAVFTVGKRTANVAAVEDCELIMIQRRELIPMIRRVPDIALRLLESLAARVIDLSEKLEDKEFRPVSERLAKCLLQFARRWGRPDEHGGIVITVPLTQSELGDLVGATRESVNKVIGPWTTQNIVAMHDGWITLKSRAALEKLAQ